MNTKEELQTKIRIIVLDYESSLFKCGLNAVNLDYDKLAEARSKMCDNVEKLIISTKTNGEKLKDIEILEAMEKYGGSFVQLLANCCYKADAINYEKLRTTFANYFLEYKEFTNDK